MSDPSRERYPPPALFSPLELPLGGSPALDGCVGDLSAAGGGMGGGGRSESRTQHKPLELDWRYSCIVSCLLGLS